MEFIVQRRKRIRPSLMLMLSDVYGLPQRMVLPLAYMVETVHNATLIIDDIEDKSETRRGQPCVHLIYGVDRSINAGILAFFLPLYNSVKTLPSNLREEVLFMFTEEMKNLHLGLAWDIYWHGDKHTPSSLPSEENYHKMVESKTSVLLRIGFSIIGIMGNLSNSERSKLSALANHIGTSFQIKDDLLNLNSVEYSKGKGVVGEDITEGKITLMVIHHVKKTGDARLLEILSQKTKDEALIREAITLLKNSGSLDYAEKVEKETMKSAMALLSLLEGDQKHKVEIGLVLEELMNRQT